MRYVCLDAGHGAPGSGCAHNGVDEAVYVLALQAFVEHELALRGIGCVLTRTGPEALTFTERARIARERNAAGVLVLHVNSAQPEAHGPLAFNLGVNVRAIDAGRAFIARLGRLGEYVDGPLLKPMKHQVFEAHAGDWTEHAWNCMRFHDEPVALFELGYCSNPDEARWMLSDAGRDALVQALADAAETMIG